MRSRIALLLMIAMMPLAVVAAVSSLLLASAAIVVAFLVVFALARSIVGPPQDRLAKAFESWTLGEAAPVMPERLPLELRSLCQSLLRAMSRMRDRESELHAATAQQELLMQEIHHRVKNNLQIVASLLNLQASRIKLPAARAEFQSARDRVRALATLHRHLYAHGELHTINLRGFLAELCGQLFSAFGETPGARISLQIDAPELQMTSDQAVPLALIVTETVSNAVKFAFPDGRRGSVMVHVVAEGDTAELAVEDDGVGLEAGRSASGETRRDGIGLQLIQGFARQLGGTLRVEEGVGTRYVVQMKLLRERPLVSVQGVRPAA